MNKDRLTVHFVSLDDPKRSVQDPALAALLEEGWSVVSHFVVERGGVPEIAFVLAPPHYGEKRSQTSTQAIMFGALIGTAIGTGVAILITSTLLG